MASTAENVLFGFHGDFEGMSLFPSEFGRLVYFCLCDLTVVDTGYFATFSMYSEHYLSGFSRRFPEDCLQNFDDEIHGGVVVVVEDDLVLVWLVDLGLFSLFCSNIALLVMLGQGTEPFPDSNESRD
jgi:hypothetical protein